MKPDAPNRETGTPAIGALNSGKTGAGLAARTCSPAPSWDDFCARMKQCAPALMPDETDSQWQNLYGVYQLGYSSALEAVMKTLEQENKQISDS